MTITTLMTNAGPLNPPPGPVAPTPGPEPRIAVNAMNTPGSTFSSVFKITQPGSYYLEGNVNGIAGLDGIIIASHGVSLDLMGFEVLGVPGSRNGIVVTSSVNNVRIYNGAVRNWGENGVEAEAPRNVVLRDLAASDNGHSGIHGGNYALVEGCTARTNGSVGILVRSGATVRACVASFNVANGVFTGSGCTVFGNEFGAGIKTGAGSTVVGCTARGNGEEGILASSASTVSGCTVSNNGDDGIQVSSGSFVVGNMCDGNGPDTDDGAGIHATGVDNRIESNAVTNNDRGIDIDFAGNLVIRNSASSNTINYDIAADNKVGVIVNAPSSSAISGSTGGAGVGTTDPWANFSF